MLSSVLTQLSDEAGAAIAFDALGNIVLLAEVRAAGERHDETVAEYVSGAARRFAAAASAGDWLAMMTTLERASNPANACLEQMVRWSLKRDASDSNKPIHTCQCKGEGSCHDQ